MLELVSVNTMGYELAIPAWIWPGDNFVIVRAHVCMRETKRVALICVIENFVWPESHVARLQRVDWSKMNESGGMLY